MDKGRNWYSSNEHTMALHYQDHVEEEPYNADIQDPFGITQEPSKFYHASTGGSDGRLNYDFGFVNSSGDLVGETFQQTQGTKKVMDILSGTCSYLTDTENLIVSKGRRDLFFPLFGDLHNSSPSIRGNHHRRAEAIAKTFTDSAKNKKSSLYSKESPVNKLEKVSKHNKLPAPIYNLVPRKQSELGFSAVCEFLDYVETGCGKSQNEAREEAAIKMLQNLHIDDDDDDDSASEDDCSFGHSLQHSAIKEDQKKLQDRTHNECKAPHLRKTNSHHKGLDHSHRDQLQQKYDSGSHYSFPEFSMKPTGNKPYVWLLQSVASKMNFEVRYEIAPLRTSNSLAQCLVHLCKDPPIVCYGSAKSENKAKSSAARCAFEYLKTVYHK